MSEDYIPVTHEVDRRWLGEYVLPDRTITIDRSASVEDLLTVIQGLCDQLDALRRERYERLFPSPSRRGL